PCTFVRFIDFNHYLYKGFSLNQQALCRLGGVKHNPTLPPNFMLGYAIVAPNLQNSLSCTEFFQKSNMSPMAILFLFG
ncbi:hypothetical protein, partial [Nostoc sp. UCD121]|uniref:hypothetical protein n=1 Tax=Nostoc sp. UCD121 TaxID=2681305 RepID=UPI001C891426